MLYKISIIIMSEIVRMVRFWRDSSNGQIPLSNCSISTNIIKVFELHWDTQLDQFINNVCEFSRKVFWKNSKLLPLTSQKINQFKGILASRQVFISGFDDSIIWALAKDGHYLVKEGYKIVQQNVLKKVVSRAYTFC